MATTEIYSKSFFCSYVPTGTTELFVTDQSRVTVFRDLEVFNGAGVSNDIDLVATISGSNIILTSVHALAAITAWQWTGRIVVPAGVPVLALATESFVHVVLSGYLLGLPPA